MSFLELWDCFIEVRENWTDNKQLLEAYLEVLKFRSEIELSYSKKLDKLCTYPFFRLGKNTYEPAIEKFKSFFMTKLLGCKNFLTDLQNEIIQPLKDLLLAQELKIRDKIESGKKLEQERKKMIKSYENSKEKYWKSCRDTLLNTKNKHEYLTKEEHNFESYCRNIDQLNRFNVVFVEDMGKNLAVFQICEEERLKHLRESFRKLFVQEDALSKCTYTELEQLPLVTNM